MFRLFFFLIFISFSLFSQVKITEALVTTINNAGQGDLYMTTDTNQLYIGLNNGKIALIGNDNSWKLNGNGNVVTGNMLGTTNDVKMSIGSDNTSIFEFGKRNTLGLLQSYDDYDDGDQYMVHLKGGGISALQFEASAAQFYKPMFFTTIDGNFRLKGSAAGTDFFELGAAGKNNNGSFEFLIGDDGDESVLFKKYNYDSKTIIEMMRLQGTGLNSSVRVGVNVGGVTPNSTMQIVGSFSLPIRSVNRSFVLSENDYTVVLKTGTYSGTAVTFPSASDFTGRIYVVKNISGSSRSISSFVSNTGVTVSSIPNGRIYYLQSDGVDWQLISDNY